MHLRRGRSTQIRCLSNINAHTSTQRWAELLRGQLHLVLYYMYTGETPETLCLRGSVLRSVLQHCKLMIQQIPSVLALPLSTSTISSSSTSSASICCCPVSLPLSDPPLCCRNEKQPRTRQRSACSTSLMHTADKQGRLLRHKWNSASSDVSPFHVFSFAVSCHPALYFAMVLTLTSKRASL